MFDPASINAAIASTRAIVDLLKGANDAHLALRISSEVATLQGKLIDVQQQAMALQNDNQALRNEINQLKTSLAESVAADPCPNCRKKGWHVESSTPDAQFGALGVARRVYKCRFCDFTESKLTK